jgi:hypothetical protein
MELIIFIGIQAVGKSTLYQQRFFHTHIRINLDMLITRHREQILLNACLAAKQPLILDNTNVTREERARYISLAKAAHFRVIGYYFQSTILEALERNRRLSRRQIIPEKASLAAINVCNCPSGTMNFDELDKRMRISETAHDHCVLPGLFMVARLDSRNFTPLTRESHHFDAPLDERMRDHMVETTRHLLQCGFQIVYGYT